MLLRVLRLLSPSSAALLPHRLPAEEWEEVHQAHRKVLADLPLLLSEVLPGNPPSHQEVKDEKAAPN